MTKRVAFSNGKGGCGKTMGIFHVAGVLASRNRALTASGRLRVQKNEKILVIDLDKQRNTTDVFLMETDSIKPKTVYDFITGQAEAQEVTNKALFRTRSNAASKYFNVDVMSGDIRFKDEDALRKNMVNVKDKLDAFIEQEGYTWVLVDMPPSNETINEICFTQIVDYIITPFTSDVESASGFGDLMESVNRARTTNENLYMLGVYLSRYMRCDVDEYVRSQLEQYGEMYIDVQIPMKTDLRDARMCGRPISFYKQDSKSRSAFETLVSVMEDRINRTVA